MSISSASRGSRREFLEGLRDHLAGVLDDSPPPHTIASLSRQLREVRAEIEALDAAENGDDITAAFNTPDAPFDPSSI